jgi:7-cyano-7-deazaguanine reductase
MPDLRALGAKVTEFAGFDTFPSPPHCGVITMTSDEVTSLCPVTGQPDWYVVTISYQPRALCLESKTLKLYLHSFRDRGAFCEAFAAQVAADVFAALDPVSVAVEVAQKPRGGVAIVARARIDA